MELTHPLSSLSLCSRADFGHVLEGYQLFQEKVHPLLVPGGVVYAHNLVHQLRLALESRKSWRRGWLWDS
mgnify:CR=1 FL=1